MRTTLLAVLLGSLLLQACDPPTATPSSPSPTEVAGANGPGTLRWALGRDPTSLDPRLAVRDDDELLVDALFDSLTRLDSRLGAQPALATDWSSNDDATRFTFALDPDATWHDGQQVTAQDVVRGLSRIADGATEPTSVHAGLLRDVVGFELAQAGGPLRGVTAPDERTVQVDLVRPVPELPEILAHPALAPVPVAVEEDPARFGEAPVGNGPFELAEPWAHNQFLRLAPSATHPDPDAIEAIVFRIYGSDEDRSVRHADLLAGQIQVSQLPQGRRDDVEGAATASPAPVEVRLEDGLAETVSMLLLDTRQPLLDDERFRRGVSLLIDRGALADRTDGAREPATSLVPPVLPGGRAVACPWCRHDPDTAERLITEVLEERAAAQDDEQPATTITLQVSDDALHGTLADQLSAGLRRFGLQVQVVRVAAGDYLEQAAEVQPAGIRLGWAPDEPTLRAWTDGLFGAGTTGARLTGWQPPALQDLLARAAASADPAERLDLWQEVEALALDTAVVAPVLFYRDDLLVAESVEGLDRDPFGNVDLARVRVPGGTAG